MATAERLLGVIDGAFSARMMYRTSKEIVLVTSADAILKEPSQETKIKPR